MVCRPNKKKTRFSRTLEFIQIQWWRFDNSSRFLRKIQNYQKKIQKIKTSTWKLSVLALMAIITLIITSLFSKGFWNEIFSLKNKLVQNVCHVEKLRALLPRFLSSSSDINVRGHACVESNTPLGGRLENPHSCNFPRHPHLSLLD